MSEEQAEELYCNFIMKIAQLSSDFDCYFLFSIVSLFLLAGFSSFFILFENLNLLQLNLILLCFIPLCISWIYFTIGAYILTYLQPKLQMNMKYMEKEFPDVVNNFSNKIIFMYRYYGGIYLSYGRSILLSTISSPLCILFFLVLIKFDLLNTTDMLSTSLITLYAIIIFICSNIFYIKFCYWNKFKFNFN